MVGMRISKAFKSEEKELLKVIFEIDEAYVKNTPQDSDDDKKSGGHSNKTHTSIFVNSGHIKQLIIV